MNIRDLAYVVAVADEKHFGNAAHKCNVSQPALSGQIRKLEDYLGVTLFERTNRSVQVTPVGERIVAQARQLITLSDEILETAQAAKDPLAGQFHLGMISTIAPYLSPLILPAIRKELPDLRLTLIEGLTQDLEHDIASGVLDAAIVATVPENASFLDVLLYEEPFWVALPSDHALAMLKTIDSRKLPNEELLLLADGHCLRDQVLDACNAATGTANTNTRQTSLGTLFALVAAGDGITLAPELSKLGLGSVVAQRKLSGAAGRVVRLACRKSYPRLDLVNRFASIIRQNVPKTTVKVLG